MDWMHGTAQDSSPGSAGKVELAMVWYAVKIFCNLLAEGLVVIRCEA